MDIASARCPSSGAMVREAKCSQHGILGTMCEMFWTFGSPRSEAGIVTGSEEESRESGVGSKDAGARRPPHGIPISPSPDHSITRHPEHILVGVAWPYASGPR